MTTPRTMLCRCEDITADDCHAAIADGYVWFEDLKRFLGVGTGPCQGKVCVQQCIRLIADARGIDPAEVDVMTFRPPVRPVPFATLAAEGALGAQAGSEATGPDPDAAEGGGPREPAGPGP